MRITKTAVLFSSLSLLLSLSACKQPSNEQPEAQEPVVSVATPDIKGSEAAAPQEEVLIDDSDAAEKTVEITDKDFGCIRDMQPVRGMYVGNLLGNIDATIAVANSEEGGAGSILREQLFKSSPARLWSSGRQALMWRQMIGNFLSLMSLRKGARSQAEAGKK